MNNEWKLEEKIKVAEQYINNKYLDDLVKYKIKEIKDFDKQDRYLRIYHITKIVYDKNENPYNKLRTVLNSTSLFCNNLALIIKGNKSSINLFLAVNSKTNIQIAGDILLDSFLANFPGSKLKRIHPKILDDITKENKNIAIANFLPSKPSENINGIYNGLEKFIDTMKKNIYTCIILAKPMDNISLSNRLKGLEELYSALSPLEETTFSNGINEGTTITDGIVESITESISTGISLASGTNENINQGTSSGSFVSTHFFLGLGRQSSYNESFGRGTSVTQSTNTSKSKQSGKSIQHSTAQTQGITMNESKKYKNKEISNLLCKIDKHISRLTEGQSFGLWETSVYFIGETKKTVSMAASSFSSLLVDENSSIENININIFGQENINTSLLLEYLRFLNHPKFEINLNRNENIIFKPINYVNGEELSLLVNLPRKSVAGVNVNSMAEFGRNVEIFNDAKNIEIGSIYHMGEVDDNRVSLNLNSLTSHCFVTGSTGSGKSNTIYKLIEEISCQNDIPFLVIEPAKGEYRNEFRNIENINLFTTNPAIDEMLKINPFAFPSGVHILEHLDRLVEIFNGCWEMYAAMPAILKESFENAYISKGWDLNNSIFIGNGEPIFPTFEDVLLELPRIINSSDYSSDTKGDYIGALVTRVNSMTNGIYGQIFCDDYEVNNEILFDEKTIIDLSRVGSSETKSLIMGILILKLTEYRMSSAIYRNLNLKHITILEEAHNILKNSKSVSNLGNGNNNVIAKSVEMIVDSIAEMRTYGEGFIIVDQSPTSVDIAAIKNTNTKIIMKLPEKEDCEIVGHSVSLSDEQIEELPKLGTGIAVIMQNNWSEANLTKIDKSENKYFGLSQSVDFESIKKFKSIILSELINQYELTDDHNIEKILTIIENFDILISKKKEMKRFVLNFHKVMDHEFDSVFFGKNMERLLGCYDTFKKAESYLEITENENGEIIPEYTKVSLNNWYHYIDNSIRQYSYLDEEHMKILKQYIIHSKKFEKHSVSYSILYNQIYQDIR